ncbi:MAG: hypothetical protein RR814_06180 [Oscillospiraceae bacterium]
MKKSTILTFICAWLPGAGQMYHGYMKRGLSLLTAFCCVVGVSGILNIWIFGMFIPVIMVYSFFDTFHVAHFTQEQRAAEPDEYLFKIDASIKSDFKPFVEKRHKIIGVGVIVLGLYMLYSQLVSPIIYNVISQFELYWLGDILRNIPTMIIAAALVWLGVVLVRGKGSVMANDIDVEFKGANDDK